MSDKPRRAESEGYWASSIVATSKRKPDAPQASDARSTKELVATYLQRTDESDCGDVLAIVHYRGGAEELKAGLSLLNSADPRERAAGADILSQLGWEDRTFLEESVDALLEKLGDADDQVVQSAIFALGHRASPRAIDALLPFVDHPSAEFRYAAVHGLMPHDTPQVVDAIIKLSTDDDRDVRDWATFTLASQFESDSPALRAALHDRVADLDSEVRGEALLGLARRSDVTVTSAVQRELEGEFHGDWAVEAAELLGNPMFLPALRELENRLDGARAVYFKGSVQSAIAACEGRLDKDSSTIQ
jgi:HEAT repeat protein